MAITSDVDVTPDILHVALWGTLAELRSYIQQFCAMHTGQIRNIRFKGIEEFDLFEPWGKPTKQDEDRLPLRESFFTRIAKEQDNLLQVFGNLEQRVDSCIRLMYTDLTSYFHARQQGQQCCAEALVARVREGLEEFEELSVRDVENDARRRWERLAQEFRDVRRALKPSAGSRRRSGETAESTIFLPFEKVSGNWVCLLIPPLPAFRFHSKYKLPDITRLSACHRAEVC